MITVERKVYGQNVNILSTEEIKATTAAGFEIVLKLSRHLLDTSCLIEAIWINVYTTWES